MVRIFYGLLLMALAGASPAPPSLSTVPEVGGPGALVAIALLGGVVALVAERRRKRSSREREE